MLEHSQRRTAVGVQTSLKLENRNCFNVLKKSFCEGVEASVVSTHLTSEESMVMIT